MIKYCEFCNSPFETNDTVHGNRKRFCNASCSAKWRVKTYGVTPMSDETKKLNSDRMKKLWENKDFKRSVIERMEKDNPSFRKECVDKAKATKLKNGYVAKNNFKYGNGKISKYESVVYDKLLSLGYYYNFAIPTKLYRCVFPNRTVPNSYKPDFTNLVTKVCIEIDGENHSSNMQRELDNKKTQCLEYLGFTVIRFTHKDIESGVFDEWLKSNHQKF